MKKFIFLCSFFLFAKPCLATENLSSLITDSRVLALDASTNPSTRFTDTQITELLNQGQRNMMAANHCIQQSESFQLTTGTTYYSLPSNYVSIMRVTIGSKFIPQLTPGALDGRSRGWEAASGYPTYYFINFSSRSLMGFAPWPAQSTDTDTVKVEYTVSANDLSASTDIPFNGITELQNFDHALAYYAAAIMNLINGQAAQGTSLMTIFNSNMEAFSKMCIELPAYRPAGIGQP